MEANPETGATELSVDDAANALMSKWEESPPAEETAEPIEAAAEENPETEEVEAEEAKAADEGSSEDEELADQEAKDDEDALDFQSIQDLADALELSPEDFLEKFKGKVKIDGQEDEVSLSEALNGYQRQADYQRKTAELAENRRQFEQAVQQQQEALRQTEQMAQASLQAAENVLLQEFQGIDWNALEQTDAGTAALYRQKFAERQQELQAYQQHYLQQSQLQQQQAQMQQAQAMENFLAQEKEALAKVDPSWNKDTSKAVTEYLTSNGFRQEEVAQLVDHRQALIAHKAMLYDQMQKDKSTAVEVAKAKVKPLPKMLKPSPKKAQKAAQADRTQKLRAKLKKTGSVQDTAALILERL